MLCEPQGLHLPVPALVSYADSHTMVLAVLQVWHWLWAKFFPLISGFSSMSACLGHSTMQTSALCVQPHLATGALCPLPLLG